jgi:Fe-S-cluster containining protein
MHCAVCGVCCEEKRGINDETDEKSMIDGDVELSDM